MTDIGREGVLWAALLWLAAIPSLFNFASFCSLIEYRTGAKTLFIHATEPYSNVVERIRSHSERTALPIPKDYGEMFEFMGITVAVLVFTTAALATASLKFEGIGLNAARTTAFLGVVFVASWTNIVVEYVEANTLTTGETVELAPCGLICAGIAALGSQLILLLGPPGSRP